MRIPPNFPWRPAAAAAAPPARPDRHQIVPPEVQVARAFVAMTGVDPTSLFAAQSPPVRQRPRGFGEAAAPGQAVARPSRPRLLTRLRRRCLALVGWAHGLWARARRSLSAP